MKFKLKKWQQILLTAIAIVVFFYLIKTIFPNI